MRPKSGCCQIQIFASDEMWCEKLLQTILTVNCFLDDVLSSSVTILKVLETWGGNESEHFDCGLPAALRIETKATVAQMSH